MKIFLSFLILLSLTGFAQDVTSLPVAQFAKKLDSAGVQLLDVRSPEEYKTGHLEGAFQADWTNKEQFEETVQHLDKRKPVYVYCLAGSRSQAAASWLAERGFTKVVNMLGGINEWKKEGLPLEAKVQVAQLNDKDYKELIQSGPLVLVDFGAEWCIPCKKMEPVIDSFRKKHPLVKFVRIDAAEQEELVKKQDVVGLPVFILYKEGKEVWRHEGITTMEEFEHAIKANYSNKD
jgi:rhodanese-related sulfurtransferase